MRLLPYNEGAAAIALWLDEQLDKQSHGMHWNSGCLIGLAKVWLPRRVDMQGWERGLLLSRKREWVLYVQRCRHPQKASVGPFQKEKDGVTSNTSLCESINAITKNLSLHGEAASFQGLPSPSPLLLL
jgi:hypothetical protein